MDRYLILSMTSNVCYLSSDLVLMTLASWTFRTTTRGAYYYLKPYRYVYLGLSDSLIIMPRGP
jgi:hypothetical protein